MYSTDVIVFNPGLLSLAVQPFKAKEQLFVVVENIFTGMFKCMYVNIHPIFQRPFHTYKHVHVCLTVCTLTSVLIFKGQFTNIICLSVC